VLPAAFVHRRCLGVKALGVLRLRRCETPTVIGQSRSAAVRGGDGAVLDAQHVPVVDAAFGELVLAAAGG
jgi:hypothetical protein